MEPFDTRLFAAVLIFFVLMFFFLQEILWFFHQISFLRHLYQLQQVQSTTCWRPSERRSHWWQPDCPKSSYLNVFAVERSRMRSNIYAIFTSIISWSFWRFGRTSATGHFERLSSEAYSPVWAIWWSTTPTRRTLSASWPNSTAKVTACQVFLARNMTMFMGKMWHCQFGWVYCFCHHLIE